MNMYEVILNILEKKGPVSIPVICHEINQESSHLYKKEKPIHPSLIKSVINDKKDLFNIQDDLVFIHPEKEVQSLTVNISGNQGPCYRIQVDFLKNRFLFFEWNLDTRTSTVSRTKSPLIAGDMESFKKELYRVEIWDWDLDYQMQGIVLDGICWSVTLETKNKKYESNGLQSFPRQWANFSRALTNLIGIDLIC